MNLLQLRGIEREEEFAVISKARREEIEDIRIFAQYRKKIPDIVKAVDNQQSLTMCCEPGIAESLPFLS